MEFLYIGLVFAVLIIVGRVLHNREVLDHQLSEEDKFTRELRRRMYE